MTGKIIAVYGPVVDAQFELSGIRLPSLHEIIQTETYDGHRIVLEVVEHIGEDVCRCIALTSTYGLKRNSPVQSQGSSIQDRKSVV